MKVQKSTYESLRPVPRATAAYLALNRGDFTEAEKLISAASRGQGHRKAFLALGQATGAYNHICGQFGVLSAGVCGVIFSGEVSSFPCVRKGPWSDEIEYPPGREALSAGRVFGSDQPGLSSL